MSKHKKQNYQTLKGFKDVLPDEQKYWDFIYERCRQTAMDYGFKRLETPILEDARIYIKGTGQHTDIVEKELYVFEDKGGNKVALRPEFTPGILRSYQEHGMVNQPQPVKFFSYGPVFRHDNPQAGRFRQFHQFNFEIIGSPAPDVDAQLITMVYSLFKSFGLDPVIELNSIGCGVCRPVYIKELLKYIRKSGKKICPNCLERSKKNPLRILDCKEKECTEATEEAPQIIDHLCEDCKNHFVKVLENLDELEVIYNLNSRLVRGLDYYSRTTFEVFLNNDNNDADDLAEEKTTGSKKEKISTLENKKIALAGGGRYDGLMEILGGRPTPALGMAGGVERVVTALRRCKVEVPDPLQADVFIAQLGESAKKKAAKLFEDLRRHNISTREAFAKNGLKAQLEVADKLKVKYTLILGQKEILDGTIIIRDMESGIQEIVVFEKVIDEIKKRLLSANHLKVYHEEVKNQPDNSQATPELNQTNQKIKTTPDLIANDDMDNINNINDINDDEIDDQDLVSEEPEVLASEIAEKPIKKPAFADTREVNVDFNEGASAKKYPGNWDDSDNPEDWNIDDTEKDIDDLNSHELEDEADKILEEAEEEK